METYLHFFVYLSSTASRKDEVASIRSKFPQKVPVNDPTSLDIMMYHRRVSYRGGGGLEFPPRNLEIEYGFVTGIKQQSCLRLHQKQFERIQIQNFPGRRGGMPPDTSSRHARSHMHACFHALLSSCFHPVLFFPTQNPV